MLFKCVLMSVHLLITHGPLTLLESKHSTLNQGPSTHLRVSQGALTLPESTHCHNQGQNPPCHLSLLPLVCGLFRKHNISFSNYETYICIFHLSFQFMHLMYYHIITHQSEHFTYHNMIIHQLSHHMCHLIEYFNLGTSLI